MGNARLNTNLKVLIVDDMPTMRRIIRNLVKQIGFSSMDEAENGQHALEKLRSDRYGLVVSDWNMPIMEGIDLLRNIRADQHLRDIPFLMITAEAEKDKIVQAIKAGVDNYIVKPFTAEILHEKIHRISEKKPVLLQSNN